MDSSYPPHNAYAANPSYMNDTAQETSQADDQQYITTFFCRALYDYQSSDDSSLSFRKGDIIEVLTQLETGWWDGLLGDERGWFPSNYVVTITDEEADIAFAASELQHAQQLGYEQDILRGSQSTSTLVNSTNGSSASSHTYAHGDHGNWLDGEGEFVPDRGSLEDNQVENGRTATQSSDFWVPQVTSDGQVSPPSHITSRRPRYVSDLTVVTSFRRYTMSTHRPDRLRAIYPRRRKTNSQMPTLQSRSDHGRDPRRALYTDASTARGRLTTGVLRASVSPNALVHQNHGSASSLMTGSHISI